MLTDIKVGNLVIFLCSHVHVFFQSINAVDDAAVFVAFTLRSLSAVVCC